MSALFLLLVVSGIDPLSILPRAAMIRFMSLLIIFTLSPNWKLWLTLTFFPEAKIVSDYMFIQRDVFCDKLTKMGCIVESRRDTFMW